MCTAVEKLLESGFCEKCENSSVASESGIECIEIFCKSYQIIQFDGSCVKCPPHTFPSLD